MPIKSLRLSYELYKSATAFTLNPVIILHGLLGCKRNWRSVACSLNAKGFGKVYCVDARNHGSSPWSTDTSYESMAEDLLNFIHDLSVTNVSVIGHSMGGKIAMTAALIEPTMIDRLVVVDIAPHLSPNKANTNLLVSLMSHVDLDARMAGCRNIYDLRAQLMEEWKDTVPSLQQRAFVLSNLVEADGKAAWKVNVKAIQNGLDQIFSFPFSMADDSVSFDGPALFVAGELSPFLGSVCTDMWRVLFQSAGLCHVEAIEPQKQLQLTLAADLAH
ncbi:unnamed protein product [Mesocestoides corti]|uniref:sn-1-specific diacylglycerol lipase ABHD11 n=1 Tax=Mesocestoides corti TaxID=53468 RepID=A0A0R3U3L3_MESCO|nr:unnamed protein product [Mesocestoides corti]